MDNKNFESKPQSRAADQLVEGNWSRLTRRLRLIAGYRIALWKMLLVIFFVTGFASALAWSMASGLSNKTWAANVIKNSTLSGAPKIVEGFPEFAVYPSATLKGSQEAGEDEEMRYTGQWSTNDPVPQVMKWYIEKIESNGWIIDVSPADPNALLVQFIKAYNEDLLLNLSVVRDQNSSLTNIVAEFTPNALIGD